MCFFYDPPENAPTYAQAPAHARADEGHFLGRFCVFWVKSLVSLGKGDTNRAQWRHSVVSWQGWILKNG